MKENPKKHPINDDRELAKTIVEEDHLATKNQKGEIVPARIRRRLLARRFKLGANEIKQILDYENYLYDESKKND